MLNDQFYKFYNLDFRILMTSHENDLLDPIVKARLFSFLFWAFMARNEVENYSI